MRIINAVALCGLTLGFVACGAKEDKKNENNQSPTGTQTSEEEKAQLEAEFSQIPAAAIVRVPVDANGETIGDPEMKTTGDANSLDSADGLAAAFESGAAPQMVAGKEELDGDSSTQSWSQWDYYGQQQQGRYNNHSQRPCTIGVGCNNTWNHGYWYNNYKPVLFTGRGWNYGIYRPTYQTHRGYRYYCYRPARYW